MSAKLLNAIKRKSLLGKIKSAEEVVKLFKNGTEMGWSGFTPAGYPKAVPIAVSNYVEKNKLQGKLHFSLYAGASTGAEAEDRWAKLGILARRWPYQTGKNIQARLNTFQLDFGDTHLGNFPLMMHNGYFTKDNPRLKGDLDLAVIEASEITEDCGLVLGAAVGCAPEFCDRARGIIVELNTKSPSLKGIHDIVPLEKPGFRSPYLISKCADRIGKPYLKVDPDKIVAIVENNKYADNGRALGEVDDESKAIAGHILSLFEHEVKCGRMPKNLLPLQSGVGSIANAVVGGLVAGPFENLNSWTEVLQDTMLDFFDSGKLLHCTATSLSLSPAGFKRFYKNMDKYLPKVCLRPQQISNNCEIIRRLGVIAMNTPVEIDMYGHANSTHVNGTKMINGIGGSGDFIRNGHLTIMHTPAARPFKKDPTGISCVVPMVSHVDHTEHDVMVFVTDQGLADMRGLGPRARAREVINKCAHPDYKAQLMEYLTLAEKICLKRKGAHESHMHDVVFQMHTNLLKNGTMKLKSWK